MTPNPAFPLQSPSIDPALLESLSRTLFVMWGFPELSQTFIERELREMHRLGGRVNVLAAYAVKGATLDPALSAIVARTRYLGHPAKILLRALRFMAGHPRRLFGTLHTLVALPHRNVLFRLRAVWMVLAAASVVTKLEPHGYRFIQAHFAAYHTELAMALSLLMDIPFGITAHATGIWKDRNILPEKISRARVVCTCTCHNRDHLETLAGPHKGKVRLIYHGLPLETLPKARPVPPGETVRFLAIGRMVQKKGFAHLIDAARTLKAKGVRFELAFIGEGPILGALQSHGASLGVSEQLQFLGKMDNRAVLERIARCHCLVVPSVRGKDGNMDGIPNVILEAMALGKPVIGSRLSGIPEVVRHERTGLVVPPGDAEALSRAMARIAADGRLGTRLGEAGRGLVESCFDVRVNVRDQLAMLHDAQAGDLAPKPRRLLNTVGGVSQASERAARR